MYNYQSELLRIVDQLILVSRPAELVPHPHFIQRGHSTTTWTEFCHFLTPPTPAWTVFIPDLFYTLSVDINTKQIFFDPLPPHIVHVVIECPQIRKDRKTKTRISIQVITSVSLLIFGPSTGRECLLIYHINIFF